MFSRQGMVRQYMVFWGLILSLIYSYLQGVFWNTHFTPPPGSMDTPSPSDEMLDRCDCEKCMAWTLPCCDHINADGALTMPSRRKQMPFQSSSPAKLKPKPFTHFTHTKSGLIFRWYCLFSDSDSWALHEGLPYIWDGSRNVVMVPLSWILRAYLGTDYLFYSQDLDSNVCQMWSSWYI